MVSNIKKKERRKRKVMIIEQETKIWLKESEEGYCLACAEAYSTSMNCEWVFPLIVLIVTIITPTGRSLFKG